MKRYFIYLLFYSIGGYILERIINLIFLEEWWDNSVLIGPYQPLYGNGVILAILFMEFVYPKIKWNKYVTEGIFIFLAILATALSEFTTGFLYEYVTGDWLWDYSETFPCAYRYVCLIPTSMFGIGSYLIVKYLHPLIKRDLDNTPKWLAYSLMVICTVDVIYTLSNLL